MVCGCVYVCMYTVTVMVLQSNDYGVTHTPVPPCLAPWPGLSPPSPAGSPS
jgi:hypothetical protein